MSRWAILRDLASDATESDVRDRMMSGCAGAPERVMIARDSFGFCAGFCWVLCGTEEDARKVDETSRWGCGFRLLGDDAHDVAQDAASGQ